MTKKSYISAILSVTILSAITLAVNAMQRDVPPVDDVYYLPGDTYRVNSAQPKANNTLPQDSIYSSQNDCQPSIEYTSIQDTVVNAVIHRCQ